MDSSDDGSDKMIAIEMDTVGDFKPVIADMEDESEKSISSLGSAPDIRDIEEIQNADDEDFPLDEKDRFKQQRLAAASPSPRRRSPRRHGSSESTFDDSHHRSRGSFHRGDLRGRGRGRGGGGRGRTGRGRGPINIVVNINEHQQQQKIIEEEPFFNEDFTPYFMITVAMLDCVLLGWEILLHGGLVPFTQNPMLGPSRETLVLAGGKYGPRMLRGEYWRFFTPIFLHVGIFHLLLNMIFTMRVGISLEKQYGAHRIAPIYVLSGLFGNLLSVVFLPSDVSVGASSALFGFFGIMLVDLIQNWKLIRNPRRSMCFLIIQLIFSLAIGLLPGIDNFSHIGGLVMGITSGFIFIPTIGQGVNAQRVFTILLCLFLLVVLFSAGLAAFFGGEPASQWCPFCENINCLEILGWCEDPFAALTDNFQDIFMNGIPGFPGGGGGGGGAGV